MKKSLALTALSALANETRLDIVRRLVPLGCKGMPAGELAKHSKVSASRLSFHLSALENAGLLKSRRESRNIIYSVQHKNLGGLIGYLMNDCCGSHPEICACMSKSVTP